MINQGGRTGKALSLGASALERGVRRHFAALASWAPLGREPRSDDGTKLDNHELLPLLWIVALGIADPLLEQRQFCSRASALSDRAAPALAVGWHGQC